MNSVSLRPQIPEMKVESFTNVIYNFSKDSRVKLSDGSFLWYIVLIIDEIHLKSKPITYALRRFTKKASKYITALRIRIVWIQASIWKSLPIMHTHKLHAVYFLKVCNVHKPV